MGLYNWDETISIEIYLFVFNCFLASFQASMLLWCFRVLISAVDKSTDKLESAGSITVLMIIIMKVY